MKEAKADMVFEISWEVCNKAGGIYTVITSKIDVMKSIYDNYFCIGPLFDVAPSDFVKTTPPAPLAEIFSQLANQGIRCVYGIWDIAGRPATILVDARSLSSQTNTIKKQLWEQFEIDSLFARNDFDEPLLWSWGVGKLLEHIQQHYTKQKIIAHAHEWLASFSLLYLKQKNIPIATVFTTHATMLGRTLASSGLVVSKHLHSIDALQEAKNKNIAEKHTTEKAAARTADVFTTVSQITAQEAEAFFDRKPLLLPNGLSIDHFPTFEEASYKHVTNKKILQKIIMSHFFSYQQFDLSQTSLFYSSGRFEFVNKGLDITIEALGKLNKELKEQASKQTIVMFFLIAMPSYGPKKELLENQNNVDGLFYDIGSKKEDILQQLVLDVLLDTPQQHNPQQHNYVHKNTSKELLSESFMQKLKRDFRLVKRKGNPPLCTHYVDDEEANPLLVHCKQAGLTNAESDRVKIVFIPSYLNARDGLINKPYYDVVSACHLGIFASHYEPWGYTPLESLALGVPAITSTATGFAQFIKDKMVAKHPGLFIINKDQQRQDMVDELYTTIKKYSQYTRSQRVASKMNAHALSTYADWRQLIRNYVRIHNKALGYSTQ